MEINFKRFLSVFLALVMVFTMLPAQRVNAITTTPNITIVDQNENGDTGDVVNNNAGATVNDVASATPVKVATLEALLDALEADNNLPIVITASIEIGAGEDVVLNLNGKSISASGMNVLRNNNGGKLTIQNGTVERTGDTAGYAVSSDNAASILIIENATIKGGVYTSGALIATNANISQHFSSRHSIYATGCKVTLNSGTYHNYNAGNATIFVTNGAEVIIEGGSFSIDNGKQTHGWTSNMIDVSNGSCVMNGGEFKGHFRVQGDGVLTINGGTFENTHGDSYQLYAGAVVKVKGGTFTDELAKAFASDNLAEGYELGEDGKVTSDKAYVAQVGGVQYEDLQEAIDAAGYGDTVTILVDMALESDLNNAAKGLFNVAADDKIILNLNGHTISVTDNSSGNFIVLYSYGDLTVKNGTIELTATKDRAFGSQSTVILNRGGKLTIESGEYIHHGGDSMAITVDNSANSFGDAYLYVNGGKIISENYIAIRMRMEDPDANGNPGNGLSIAEVTGGYIYGANRGIWGQKSSGANAKQGQLTVTGGVVENNRADRGAIQIDTDSYEAQNMLVSISGNATIKGAIMGGDDEFAVSGGIFTVAVPEKYCAEGFEPKANEDGTYGVEAAPVVIVAHNQAELQAALDNCASNTVIQLAGDMNYGTVYFRVVPGNAHTQATGNAGGGNRDGYLRTIKNISIIGAEGALVDAILFEDGAIANNRYAAFVVENLLIEGITFTADGGEDYNYSEAGGQAFDDNDRPAILLRLANISFDGITIKNCTRIGESASNFVRMYAGDRTAKNLTITGCTIESGKRLCSLRPCENVTITNNTINNTAQHAIHMEGQDARTYTGAVTITANAADSIGNRFVRATSVGSATVVITDNTITNYLGEEEDFIKVTKIDNTLVEITESGNTMSRPAPAYVAFIDTDKDGVLDAGETGYTDLQAAIDAAGEGATIVLLADVKLSSVVEIPADKIVVLDLNGKAITCGEDGYCINNEAKGIVTINDSVGGGVVNGVVYNASGSTMIINGGTYNAVDNWALLNNAATMTINGGVINGKNSYPIYSYNDGHKLTINNVTVNGECGCINAYYAGEVIINNGTFNFTGREGNTYHVVYVSTGTTMTINGGTFKKVGDVDVNGEGGGGICANGTGKLVITGGTFDGAIRDIDNYSSNTTIEVSGGTFSDNSAKNYVVDGFELKQNDDGTFGVAPSYVAEVNGVKYTDLQEAIKAAAPSGTVEILTDVTVDKWLMMTEQYSIGGDQLINVVINGMVINGNGHTLTVKAIESAGNGNHLFDDARNLTVNDLTIVNESGKNGGIGLISGTISNVTFSGGVGVFPGIGNVVITDCNFVGGGDAIYFESERDNLVVTGCTFDVGTNYAIILRGAAKFINNTVTSGKVNVANSATGEISNNNFGDNRFKVYNGANATITGNTINNLVFNDATVAGSTFENNTLSESAQAALDAVTAPDVAEVNGVGYKTVIEALLAAVENGYTEVKILQSVREKMPTDIELVVNADLLITADSAVEVKFYNEGTSYDFVFNSNNYNTITIGKNVTFQLEDRVIWLGYYGNNVTVKVDGALVGYQIWHGADTNVSETGTLKTTGEALIMRRGATMTVNGGKVVANYFNILAGNIDAKNGATIECGAFWIDNTGSYAGEGGANISIWNSTLTSSGNLKASTSNEDGISIDIYNSVVSFTDYDGYGASTLDANTTLYVNGEDAKLTVKNLINNGLVEIYDDGVMNVSGDFTANSSATVNVEDGTLTVAGKLTNLGVDTTFKDATVKINKLDSDAALFLDGTVTIQVEDATGSSYAIRVKDGVVFNNSYIKGTANETVRLLGSATFNGGFKCAYLQGSSAGVGGTVTIEDGTVVEASYGVEFSKGYEITGGTIKLSGGNADGKLWGMVFQSGEFVINSDLVVVGNAGAYAPIHFTDATVTVNGSISQSNSGGEPLYIGVESNVTFGADAVIDTLSIHGAGKLNLVVDANGNYAEIKCGASGFTGELAVVGNTKYEAKKVDGKIVVALKPVAMIGTQGYATLAGAIAAAQDDDVIELLSDITTNAVILIGKSVTIDGNNHTITSSATRIFRITTGNVQVTMNNLNMVNNAVRVGENDIRGVSIDTGFTGIELTLNNCSVDFTDATASDYSYAINIVGGSGHTLTINGGSYEGANVVNLWGNDHKVSVTNATLTSIYAFNELYFGGIVRVEGQIDELTLKNNTFNGAHAVVISYNYKEGASIQSKVEENNTDNTKLYSVKTGSNYYHSLQDAIAAAQNGDTVTLLRDIELTEGVTVPVGKNITLDLNGNDITMSVGDVTVGTQLICNKGTLTITDSDEVDGEICLTYTGAKNASVSISTIRNEGVLNIAGGIINCVNGNQNISYAIDAFSFDGNGTVNISGGIVKGGASGYCIRMFLSGAANTLNVTGGEVDYVWAQQTNANANKAEINVTGGFVSYVYVNAASGGCDVSNVTLNVKADCTDWEPYVGGNGPYVLEEVDGVYKIVKKVYVAEVNGVKYTDLQEAIAVGGKVTLLADVTINETIQILAGNTVELDLNGFTINAGWESEADAKHIYVFHNYGTFTITGNGVINTRGIFNYGTMTLESGTINAIDCNGGFAVRIYAGTFTMNGGSIATTYEDGDKPGNGYDACPVRVDEGAEFIMNAGTINNVSNYTVAVDNYGTTTINGGTFTTIHTTIANSGTMTINGGTFTCNGLEGITAHAVWAAGGTLTINGGTFDGKDNYNGFNVDASEGAVVYIKGGNFLSVHSGSLYGEGTIAVSGGIFFDKVPADRCAEGFQPKTNADGTYGVELKPVVELNFQFGQTSQIWLIEPWALRANLYVYHVNSDGSRGAELTAEELAQFDGYGVYFIRESDLGIKDATQDNVTVDDIINNENAILKTMQNGCSIKSADRNGLWADFDEGIYTYQLSDSIFVLYYIVVDGETIYAPIRERNLSQMVEDGITDTKNYKDSERAIFEKMHQLETDILEYRGGSHDTTLEIMDAPTLGQNPVGTAAEHSLSFGHTTAVSLIEPWGIQFNGRVRLDKEYDDYGVIVFYDTENVIDGTVTADMLLAMENAYVFSYANGDATIQVESDGRTRITALYNSGLYTYQMRRTAYVMFYVKDGDNIYCGPVKERSIESAILSRLGVTGVVNTLEGKILQDMLALYEVTAAHRGVE